MKPHHVKLALAAVWMVMAFVLVAVLGHLRSPSDVLMLAAVAVAAPAALWFWWNYPAETMSESIHAVRRNDAGKTGRQTP